jgi:hypothetical protein
VPAIWPSKPNCSPTKFCAIDVQETAPLDSYLKKWLTANWRRASMTISAHARDHTVQPIAFPIVCGNAAG